ISVQLVVKIVAGTTRGNLSNQLGSTRDIAVPVDTCLATMRRVNKKKCVRLWHVVHVQSEQAAMTASHSRSGCPVRLQPTDHLGEWDGMAVQGRLGRDVNNAFDELHLPAPQHRVAATLEFTARQTVAVLKARDGPARDRHGS